MPPKKIPLLVKKSKKVALVPPQETGQSKQEIQPEPESGQEKKSEPVQEPEQVMQPVQEPEQVTQLVQEPEHVMQPEPVKEPEQVVQSEPVQEPEHVMQPEPVKEPEQVMQLEAEQKQGSNEYDAHDVEIQEPEPEIKEEYITLSPEQKEDLIDKLESKKHKLKKAYKHAISDGVDVTGLKEQLKEVGRLLSEVKECDAVDKVSKNKQDAERVSKDFKRKYKELAMSDFKKIIDLTAPKEERKPDISTEQIWHRSKDVIFKNKTYRPPPEDKLSKFNDKMKLKTMPKHIKKELQKRTDNNVKAINIHNNHQDKLKYRQYDPLSFNGLNIY